MDFKDKEDMLVLSNKPAGCRSIREWCPPFEEKETIAEIEVEYNQKCFELCQKEDWDDERIREDIAGINVLQYDLSMVHDLEKKRFKNITFILIDLDITKKEEIDEIKKFITNRMNYFRFDNKRYYLIHVSSKTDKASYKDLFESAPVVPSNPSIIKDKNTFIKYLCGFCKLNQLIKNAIWDVMKDYV